MHCINQNRVKNQDVLSSEEFDHVIKKDDFKYSSVWKRKFCAC